LLAIRREKDIIYKTDSISVIPTTLSWILTTQHISVINCAPLNSFSM